MAHVLSRTICFLPAVVGVLWTQGQMSGNPKFILSVQADAKFFAGEERFEGLLRCEVFVNGFGQDFV